LNAQGNYDRDLDGNFDATYLFRVNGVHELDPQAQIGLQGTVTLPASPERAPGGLVEVPYRPTDTVQDVVTRMNNSGAEVVARLNRNGQLEIKATIAESTEHPDFVLRHLEDSGQFLTGYAGILTQPGPGGAFTWEQADAILALRGQDADGEAAGFAVAPLQHPSGWIGLNPEMVRDPAGVASSLSVAGRPGESGDGGAALAIAGLRNQPVGIGRAETLDDYFADSVARAGLRGEEAENGQTTFERIRKDLSDLRESISGVNIDEELAQMLKFQHGYQAAARFVANVDEMLDTIINRMGV
jgi:flagellar hook-associated protein 1 FlgK